MKRIIIVLVACIFALPVVAQFLRSGWIASNTVIVPVATPSASWTGTAGQIAAPAATTQTILAINSDTGSSNAVQLSVSSTAQFSVGGIVCVKFVNGVQQANGCYPVASIKAAASCINTSYACLDLNGATYQSGDSFVVETPNFAVVGVAYGAQTLTGVTSGSLGSYKFTVASTAAMATGDQYSIFNVSGTAVGNYPITVDDSTHFELGTSAQPGPTYAATSVTSTSVVAFDELVIAGMDEHSGVVIESQNSEYVTIGAAIGNRQWINKVNCYYENATPVTILYQSANPKYGDDGWVVELNGPSTQYNGDAILTCDVIPIQGMARRLAINTWLNSQSGGTNYVTRPTMYVDSVSGKDPAATANATYTIATDATGKVLTVSGTGSGSLNESSIIAVCNSACGSSDTIKAQSQVDPLNASNSPGCTGTSTTLPFTCYLETSIGANLSSPAWTTNSQCVSTFGTSGNPYQTLRTATNCLGGNNSAATGTSNGNGTIIYATNGETFTEPMLAPCVGGVCKGATRMTEVRAATAPVAVTGIASWSSGTVTLNVVNSWSTGNKVLVTGMYPAEYNGLQTLTGATSTTISYTCCTIAGQSGNLNPATVHSGVTQMFGKAVIPYTVKLLVRGQWVQALQNVEYESASIDGATVGQIQGCIGANCAPSNPGIQPLAQNTVINNSAWIDSNGVRGPAFGYYAGATPSMWNFSFVTTAYRDSAIEESYFDNGSLTGAKVNRNVNGYVPWTLGAYADVTNVGEAYFNINVSNPVTVTATPQDPSVGVFQGYTQRLTQNPADGATTTACTGSNGPYCMPAVTGDAITYSGGQTTFNVYANQASGFVSDTTALFQSGNCVSSGTTAIGGIGNVATIGSVSGGKLSVTLTGQFTAGGLCGSSGIAAGDTLWIYNYAHQDWNQGQNVNSNQTQIDFNVYQHRVSYIGWPQVQFSQAGSYSGGTTSSGSNVTANLTSSGQTVTISSPGTSVPAGTVPEVGDFVNILSGSNIHQYRQIVGIVGTFTSTGQFIIDRPFTPDIATAAEWAQGKPFTDVATVASRVGGNSTTGTNPIQHAASVFTGGNAGDAGQVQHGNEHILFVQDTFGYVNTSYRSANSNSFSSGQGPGFGLRYFSVLDSLMGAGCTSTNCSFNQQNTASMPADNPPNWSQGGTTTAMDGFGFDTNTFVVQSYSSVTYAPGTNIGSQTVTLTDSNYRPTGLTQAVSGYQGGIAVSGAPLSPFTGDGVSISAGAVVGAMQH